MFKSTNKSETMSSLTNSRLTDTFGGYAPPSGSGSDIFDSATLPVDPQPYDPKCW